MSGRIYNIVSGLQEDPYRLAVLAKDINHVCVTSADFFFADGEMSIVTGDEEGVIRMYGYDPNGTIFSLCSRRLRLMHYP